MKRRTWVLSAVLVAGFSLGAQAQFQVENFEISGDLEICVDDSTTLTAEWSVTADVSRFEWIVNQSSQGEVVIPDGPERRSGTRKFTFEGELAGQFEICFRIWHHTQTDRDATECVTITVVECADCEWVDETAWADGDRYVEQGNWATYTEYEGEEKSVILYAGQNMDAGTVHFSAVVNDEVTITINLNPGWRFADVNENVKIQDYESAPSGNPSPGLFTHKDYADPDESSFKITVPANNYYGVHVDVEWEDCSEE